MEKKIKLLILPGDGIGVEVMDSVLPLFDKFNLPFDIKVADIGWECWKESGDPVPGETWRAIERSDSVLLGAITSKPRKEAVAELSQKLDPNKYAYVSPIVQLRQKLNLFANVRPIFDLTGDDRFNFCIIRENTEGLYSGFDYDYLPDELYGLMRNKNFSKKQLSDASCTIRLQTAFGLERVYQYAFEYAQRHRLKKVTLADKPNVLRASSTHARGIFEAVAAKYADVTSEILNVDAVGLWMVRRPEKFGVIVAENMFGDILSDVGAGVMGGLGFAPSANHGNKFAYFEPVHGSAPSVRPNTANPSAMFLTVKLLLEHHGYFKEALHVLTAVKEVFNKQKLVTYDQGGKASTQEVAQAIIHACEERRYVSND